MNDSSFSGRVAVVTGAGTGIGRAIAQSLAAEETILYLLGRTEEALEETARSVEGKGSCRIFRLKTDLTKDGDVRQAVGRVKEQTNRVDFLVHCAAQHSLGSVESAPAQRFDELFHINVRAPYLLTQLLLPLLRSSQGQIVFINSLAGVKANAKVSQYAATKHALKALADSLRNEVNPESLRVLSIFIGRTATPMQESVHALEGRPYRPNSLMQPEDVAAMIVSALRQPLTSQVTEIYMEPLGRIC